MDLQKIKLFFVKNKDRFIKYLFITLSVVISGLIIYYRNDLSKLQAYGYLGIFLISILGNSTVIIPAPVILTTFIGGGIYNPIAVGLITALGATIGELTGYMAGYGGTATIKEDKKYKKIQHWIEKKGFLTISILAAIPNPLFDLAGIVSGVTQYPLKKFFLATLLGKSIKFIVVAFIGAIFT